MNSLRLATLYLVLHRLADKFFLILLVELTNVVSVHSLLRRLLAKLVVLSWLVPTLDLLIL
jgi:hypothetical protein